jgi:hypothetical protein
MVRASPLANPSVNADLPKAFLRNTSILPPFVASHVVAPVVVVVSSFSNFDDDDDGWDAAYSASW